MVAEKNSVPPTILRRHPYSRTSGPKPINSAATTPSRNCRTGSDRAEETGAAEQDPATTTPAVDTVPDSHRGGGPPASRGATTKDNSRDLHRETNVKQRAIFN